MQIITIVALLVIFFGLTIVTIAALLMLETKVLNVKISQLLSTPEKIHALDVKIATMATQVDALNDFAAMDSQFIDGMPQIMRVGSVDELIEKMQSDGQIKSDASDEEIEKLKKFFTDLMNIEKTDDDGKWKDS